MPSLHMPARNSTQYTKDVEVNGYPRSVQVDDTAGQEAYADLRSEKLGTGDVRVPGSVLVEHPAGIAPSPSPHAGLPAGVQHHR